MTRLAPVAALSVLLTLTACSAAPAAHPTGSASATSTASATPTSASTAASSTPTAAPADASILFTISATVTLGTGEVGHVVQTVHKPESAAPDQAAVEAVLDEQCDGWRGAIPAAQYVHARITATTDGSSVWANRRIGVSMNGDPVYIGPAFFGDFGSFQAPCNTVGVHFPGTIDGYTPVPAGGGADSAHGWATLFYGFGTFDGSDIVLTDCAVVLGPDAAATSAIAAMWPTTPQVYPGATCDVNR